MADLEQARSDVSLLTAALLEHIDRAWERLTRAEQALVQDYLTLSSSERRRRERELLDLAERLMTDLDQVVKRQLGVMLHGAYQAGGVGIAAELGASETFTAEDTDRLRAVARDTYTDVLRATRPVEQTTKELIRILARQAATDRFAGGVTAEQAGRDLAARLAGHGISAIVYRDGSRHGLADYANMLLRTKTAEIYQAGGFSQARALDVRFMEILDNPSCGLSYHDDPTLANGLILPLSEAEKYPISHPRCVRVTTPRVDLLTPQDVRHAQPSTTAGQNADQRAVEQTRAAAAARRATRRTLEQRTTRSRAGLLTPSSGAATSPAARRAAARVARHQRPGGTS